MVDGFTAWQKISGAAEPAGSSVPSQNIPEEQGALRAACCVQLHGQGSNAPAQHDTTDHSQKLQATSAPSAVASRFKLDAGMDFTSRAQELLLVLS